MAASIPGPTDEVTAGRAGGEVGLRSTGERLILVAATGAFGLSVTLHLGVLTGADLLPAPPWSWALHAGVVVGFWLGAGRIAAARLWGVAGLLRMRRMIPIPVRLALGAATLNTLVLTGLALSGGVAFGRALLAYWTMMYLLIAVIFAFVVPGIRAAEALPVAAGGRA